MTTITNPVPQEPDKTWEYLTRFGIDLARMYESDPPSTEEVQHHALWLLREFSALAGDLKHGCAEVANCLEWLCERGELVKVKPDRWLVSTRRARQS